MAFRMNSRPSPPQSAHHLRWFAKVAADAANENNSASCVCWYSQGLFLMGANGANYNNQVRWNYGEK